MPVPIPVPVPVPRPRPVPGPGMVLIYVTYVKDRINADGSVTHYSGRAMGIGDPRNLLLEAQRIVSRRDATHHIRGFGPAVLDEFTVATLPFLGRHADPAYQAIRGREQQMIDFFGGSISDGGTSGNPIRGVGAGNVLGRPYHNAATLFFGELHPYTGR